LKLLVLCTTSTLAMGINLPARLVIIKSTKSYKGSGKGYQEYTQIELDQMMGRAGRIPFDKEGTVVIMTEKANYNKYTGENKLENLESQLYNHLIDHLNTEISLKSIQSFSEAIEYFRNSFCYIRMQNSPKLYNLYHKNAID
jgi:ATP-dependent DNA helicase HFM1/MER3